ncbi:MAG: HigA family addiction module antidote protein [Gammaproteobacteria bacterium]|nr:HigA family addiction module antidote protein [Gammaproteobacteria bacterium]
MPMHSPPHPGAFIQAVYLTPFNISIRYLAKQLNVSSSTLSRVIKGQSSLSPEMALKLSKAIGRPPESWLSMQDHYDLWQAKQHVNLSQITPLEFVPA